MANAEVQAILSRELARTRPDYVCYRPGHWDGSTGDSLNEHFLAFDGPDGSLQAVWTQSAAQAAAPGRRQCNRIVFSRSDDEGVTWSRPVRIAGPADESDPAPMASWAFPLVSRSGRLTVVYNQHTGVAGWIAMHTGTVAAVTSDDAGRTWSEPAAVPFPWGPYDDPQREVPAEWIVWQAPLLDLAGRPFVGYSHWTSPRAARRTDHRGWTGLESVCEFLRFTNLDDDPPPGKLAIEFSAWGAAALRVPHYRHPDVSVTQEPSLVRLPDESLFCVMRTCTGYLWWSRSSDDGRTWCDSRPLLNRDAGTPVLNPVSPAPIYPVGDGRYLLFHTHHRGETDGPPACEALPRRPCHVQLGEFRPGADQPVWFGAPSEFMDNDDTAVDGVANTPETPRHTSLSLYSSFTCRGGNRVLWYPDRKFFLLGKRLTDELIDGLDRPPTRQRS